MGMGVCMRVCMWRSVGMRDSMGEVSCIRDRYGRGVRYEG